jgi:thioredoxin-related protein
MMKSFSYKYAASFLVLLGVFAFAFYSIEKSSASSAPGTVVWHSFNDGINLARNSNKKVLVDVYTNWCGWCKKMDAEVYTDKEVSRLLKQDFILVKLNAESSNALSYKGNSFTEAEFARELGVTGYPTTLFFDQNSNPITNFPGYAPPGRFAKVLDFIGKDYYKSVSFQEYDKSHSSLP